jgi:hypothetical protein
MLPLNQKLALAAGLLAFGMALPTPVVAGASGPAVQLSQVAPPRPAPRPPVDPVEARIKELRDKLHITDAQVPQWNEVAQTMRDNAKASQQIVEEGRKNEKTMTAVDDLKLYAQLAETHAAGVKKLATAFETLYGQLSVDQKKAADAAIREYRQAANRRVRTMKKAE